MCRSFQAGNFTSPCEDSRSRALLEAKDHLRGHRVIPDLRFFFFLSLILGSVKWR